MPVTRVWDDNSQQWISLLHGPRGRRGHRWTSGDGPPAGLAPADDLHLDLSTGDVYESDGAAWTIIGNIKGPQGIQGNTGTINIGTTTTGAPDSSVEVVNEGTPQAAVLAFTIPKGDKGDQGDPGPQNVDGGHPTTVMSPHLLIDGGTI